MRVSIEISGFEALLAELEKLPATADKSTARVLNGMAADTVQRAKKRITTGARSGRIYRKRGRLHQASAPGEPPANFTGALASDLSFTPIPENLDGAAIAGTTRPYAAILEFGGFFVVAGTPVFIAERPYLVPSVEEAIQGAGMKLKEEFERRLK